SAEVKRDIRAAEACACVVGQCKNGVGPEGWSDVRQERQRRTGGFKAEHARSRGPSAVVINDLFPGGSKIVAALIVTPCLIKAEQNNGGTDWQDGRIWQNDIGRAGRVSHAGNTNRVVLTGNHWR